MSIVIRQDYFRPKGVKPAFCQDELTKDFTKVLAKDFFNCENVLELMLW